MSFTHFYQRIKEKTAQPHAAPVLIVAFGDSVTQGMTELGVQESDSVYHARLKRMLEAAHPLATFSVINAGQSGQSAPGALASLERDVLRHQPDLTLISFGLNDAWNREDGLAAFTDALAVMYKRIRAETHSDIIALTPTFMNKADNARVAAEHRNLVQGMADIMNSGALSAYADAVRATARSHNVRVADVYAAWEHRAANGVDTDRLLANGLNHPTGEAHAIAADVLMQLIREQKP